MKFTGKAYIVGTGTIAVTIPANIRDFLKIKVGDLLEMDLIKLNVSEVKEDIIKDEKEEKQEEDKLNHSQATSEAEKPKKKFNIN